MSKVEVLKALGDNGLLEKFNEDGLWTQAFKLYNEANNQELKTGGCSCHYRTVLKWLKA